jgi:FK506-binding protein 14
MGLLSRISLTFLVLLFFAIDSNQVWATDDVKSEVLFVPTECTRKSQAGDTIAVHYTGMLSDGKKFDSSLDRNEPFVFSLGSGQVIQGWEKGLSGLCVGEKRKLTIPSSLGYGEEGAGNVIPPNAELIFEVELVGFPDPSSSEEEEFEEFDDEEGEFFDEEGEEWEGEEEREGEGEEGEDEDVEESDREVNEEEFEGEEEQGEGDEGHGEFEGEETNEEEQIGEEQPPKETADEL